MEGSGYASPDIFKTPAPDSTQTVSTEAPVVSIAPASGTAAPSATEVAATEVANTEVVKPDAAALTIPVKAEPAVQVLPPAAPATQTNPLEALKPEDIAAFYKDKRTDLLKALGLDEFSIEAIRYYEATGGLAEYATVKSVDYSKMSDEDVIRKNLREEFAHLSLEADDLELLYENRITNRFKLDDTTYSEREVKAGKLEMKLEADKLRKAYIESQKKFAPPEKAPAAPEQSDEEITAIRLQAALSDSSVQQFISGKKLVLGSGDQSYNYEIANPQDLLDILFQPDSYAIAAAARDKNGQPLKDKNGSYIPDYNRLLKAVAVLRNPEEYDKLLIDHGRSLGTKEHLSQLENPTNSQAPSADGGPTTVWGAMKQGMRWV